MRFLRNPEKTITTMTELEQLLHHIEFDKNWLIKLENFFFPYRLNSLNNENWKLLVSNKRKNRCQIQIESLLKFCKKVKLKWIENWILYMHKIKMQSKYWNNDTVCQKCFLNRFLTKVTVFFFIFFFFLYCKRGISYLCIQANFRCAWPVKQFFLYFYFP